LVEALGDEFDFYVVTRDRDSGMSAPYREAGHGDWIAIGKGRVRYLEESQISVRQIVGIFDEIIPEVVILNSFFDPIFTHRVLFARRLGKTGDARFLLAPRGEFSPGALGLKGKKKRLFLLFAKVTGLYKGLMWQASSANELKLIHGCFLRPPVDQICVARNIGSPATSVDDSVRKQRQKSQALRVVFLSRIVPMKNLDFALEILRDVKEKVVFSIFGPVEDRAYWDACTNLISALPENVSVRYLGEVEPGRVHSVLADNDLFLLPTRGENFGHVIHEALQAGLPVLISDQTPWDSKSLKGAGWAVPLDQRSEFVRIIKDLAATDPDEQRKMSEAASSVVSSLQRLHCDVEANRKLLEMLISSSSKA
jgi:glycosyltransferase involved in cell wall biosynthesis